MPILFAFLAILVLLWIFGFSTKNIFSGIGSFAAAIFIGAMGIAALGTAIAFPPFALAIVLFLVLKGLFSK